MIRANAREIPDILLENVTGGGLNYCPSNKALSEMGLSGMVRSTGGWFDIYYDIRQADGTWRNVGSKDMYNYVKETLGENDKRFKALYNFCYVEKHKHMS